MIINIQPKSELLRKHISGFNMFEKRKDFSLNFFAFPQLGSTIELYENATITRSINEMKVKPVNEDESGGEKKSHSIEILGRYTEPIFISYEGYVNGFTINFKPLGINYFFDKPYKVIAPNNFQKSSDTTWNRFAEEVLVFKNFEERVEFAEFFLEKLIKDIHIIEIERAVETMIKDPSVNINEIASSSCVSIRSLHRKFNDYVGCSPMVYKRIVRFRKSIDFDAKKQQNLNLTEISHINNFFDTSHFRREFLKLTHQNPVDFFRTISEMGNYKFPYRLI
jgi:AraC-like DNA-binding protein